MAAAKKVGLYLNAHTINQNSGYLELLQDKLGLNLVIISFTGKLSQEVVAQSPFDGLPPSDERIRSLLSQHLDGQPSTDKFGSALRSVGPHVSAEGDDEGLREAIRKAKDNGIEVWLLGGVWTASDYDVLMFCPSKEENNRWYQAVFTHLATNYGADGVDVTHARYPMTSYPRGLFLCTCHDCAQAAAEMGYDMAQMKVDIHAALARLKHFDGKRLVAIGKQALGPFDFMQMLEMRPGVVQWFTFRAELLGRNLKRFRDAVHAAAGQDFIFGADTYPASLSMFVGHNHANWHDYSDFASPLLSHADIFPLQTLVVWAQFLQSLFPDISEEDALALVYRFVGYDGLGLPVSIEDFALGEPDCEYRNVPLKDLVMLDMAKARLYLPEGIPSYPILQGGGAPHLWPRQIIEDLIARAEEIGHDGIIFQGTQSLVDYDLRS